MSHTKTHVEYFRDWEAATFGFGYGTGEEHIVPALRRFLELCKDGDFEHAYDSRILEAELTPAVAWLLINALCRADIIEYGTSPRCGWLTGAGEALREFVLQHTADELIEMLFARDDYNGCRPQWCYCGLQYVAGPVCPNPFWERSR